VRPEEADTIAGALGQLHAEAMRAGMALGASSRSGVAALTRSYGDLVARLDDRKRVLLIVERAGGLVGMAQLVFSGVGNASHRAEVQRVAVAEEVRGTGIGRALMRAVEDTARGHGVTLLWLTTHDGTDACRFYEAIGYTKLGVMPNYSRRPDGTLWPGAFYFRELAAGLPTPRASTGATSTPSLTPP